MSKKKTDTKIRRSSGNVFADLGFPDAGTHLLKAQLVSRAQEIITERKLTQTDAAHTMGVSQPIVARMFKGRFRDLSIERIMRMLTNLGCEVDIVAKA